ncbi:MAG: sugar phosphate isomerase/epimerase [Chloroflexi bacterium]|nr:sugar phosphate isomerase/epimerase [Chloroflexota bacterium]
MTLPIGLQLYTVREQLKDDYSGVIHRLADIGYAGVEPFGVPDNLDEQAALLKELDFQIPSAHVPVPEGEKLADVLRIARIYGISRVIAGYGPDEFRTLDEVKRTCERLNGVAQDLGQHGLTFGYHNHWWEIEPVEGQRPYEIMLQELDPAIFFEVDVYWAKVGGLDPVQFIKESGQRATFLHIKDGPADAPKSDMVAAGQGVIDITAVIEAAEHAEWLIVELDRCATDMLEAVEASYRYLVNEGLGHGR